MDDVTSLMDLVYYTLFVLLGMAGVSCFMCASMKLGEMRMKYNLMDTARARGFKVDLEKLESMGQPDPSLNDNCTIMVPDVAIVL